MIIPTKSPAAPETLRSPGPASIDPSGAGADAGGAMETQPSAERRVAIDSADEDPRARDVGASSELEEGRPDREQRTVASRTADAAPSSCLSDDTILAYRYGQASSQQLLRIDEHLDRCRRCQELVDIVIQDQLELDASPSQLTTFHPTFLVAERYRVDHFLGRGGMGEVYAATDELTGSRVALKTVLCTAADDPRAVRKLFGEVLNAQRVAHPHVFKIYDLHEHHDMSRGRVPFFTMEFIAGESLGKRLRRLGALSIADARVIAEQLLSGLGAAHAKGVLHLDFKSDNVMLRDSAELDAVIMDFGLSRVADVESKQRTSERLQGAGTMPYMSIEQLECRSDISAAADVYAFGVVLYEMLTGCLPFRGDSLSAILLKQIAERPVAPSRLVPELAPNVEAFVLKCLSRQAAGRYPNAGAALSALAAIEAWQRKPRQRARRRAWLALAAALVLTVGIAGWRARASRSPALAAPPLGALVEASPVLTPASPSPAPAAKGVAEPEPAPEVASKDQKPPRKAAPARPAKAPPAPSNGPVPGVETPNPPGGWRGPPPKAVPRPRPL